MRCFRITALFLTLLCAGSCATIEYSEVQSDFESAVRIDNERLASPFTDGTEEFAPVLEQLTPGYIDGLDARLQANAWMLRGVAAWRSAAWSLAMDASAKGMALNPGQGSRDAVILNMLPGLVFADQTLATWNMGAAKDIEHYEELRDDMRTAWSSLLTAEQALSPSTSASTRSYLHYQKWRVALNWAGMIADASDGIATADEMNNWAKDQGGLGEFPGRAALNAETQVKGPLRTLIELQS